MSSTQYTPHESETEWVERLRQIIPTFEWSAIKPPEESQKVVGPSNELDVLIGRYAKLYQLAPCIQAAQRYDFGYIDSIGYRVFTQFFQVANSRGTVVVVHGYTDHSGLYHKLILHLLRQQWNVYIYDQPGHGLSTGDPLNIHSFREYDQLLVELMNSLVSETIGPVYLVGQSMGAGIVSALLRTTSRAQKQQWRICGNVLLAPLIIPRGVKRMLLAYVAIGWWKKHIKRSFNRSSHDESFLTFREQQDVFQYQRIPVAWVGALLRWVLWMLKRCKDQQDNIVIIQGSADQTVSWRFNNRMIKRRNQQTVIHKIKGARHHLVCESEVYTNQVFQYIDQFMSVD